MEGFGENGCQVGAGGRLGARQVSGCMPARPARAGQPVPRRAGHHTPAAAPSSTIRVYSRGTTALTRNVVFFAQRDGGFVHHVQLLLQHLQCK